MGCTSEGDLFGSITAHLPAGNKNISYFSLLGQALIDCSAMAGATDFCYCFVM